MQDARIYTAIDVGTTKVCTIIGRHSEPGDLDILAHSVVPCGGLRKGNVSDVAATTRAIRASVAETSRLSGIKIRSAYIGITGSHVSYENRHDDLRWVGKQGVITSEDLTRVPKSVSTSSSAVGRTVIHALPMNYTLDGKNGIRDPLGMHTHDLNVETHVVMGASSLVRKLSQAAKDAGLGVDALVLEPLASSMAVLTAAEKSRKVVLVDIGGGTTDVVLFSGGSVRYTGVIPVGGYQFTNDICLMYNTLYQAAEEAKIKYGHVEPGYADPGEEISLPVFGRSLKVKVPHHELCQLIRERAQELVRLIKLKLQEGGVSDTSEIRMVLTGGCSNLNGLLELVQQNLTKNVRQGIPSVNRNIPAELRAPNYATGVGILLWAISQKSPSDQLIKKDGHSVTVAGRILTHVKDLLP